MDPLRVVNMIEEKGGGDLASEKPMEGGETNKERDTDRSHNGSRPVIDDLQVDHRSTSVLPVVNTIQEQVTSDGESDRSKNEAGRLPEVTTQDKTCPAYDRTEEEPNVSTYRHESEELYTKDVDQHMAVLTDIGMPTALVTIDDIQVNDPDVPLTEDQKRLRQRI